MKLTTSTLKVHLLKAHDTNTEVRAAYHLDEAEKMVRGTPHQGNLKYAKTQAKHEGQLDLIFSLLKIIEFFGGFLYPKKSFDDCISNKLFKNWESGLPFPVFSKGMYEKMLQKFSQCVCVHCLHFARPSNLPALGTFLSTAPIPEEVEEKAEDVLEVFDHEGEVFECFESEYEAEDENLDLIDAFM